MFMFALSFELTDKEKEQIKEIDKDIHSKIEKISLYTPEYWAYMDEWQKRTLQVTGKARMRNIKKYEPKPKELIKLLEAEINTLEIGYFEGAKKLEADLLKKIQLAAKNEVINGLLPYLEIVKNSSQKDYQTLIKLISKRIGIKEEELHMAKSHSIISLMFNGKAVTALGRAKTRGKIDEMSSTVKIEGVNIFMPESTFKIGVGTSKIFRYAVAEFTKHNSPNSNKFRYNIFLDVKDYAEANGVDTTSESAMKNFRFKLRKNLETLRYSGVSWQEKIKGKPKSFGGMNYIGKYDLKGDTLEIEFTVTMAEYLTSLPLIQYPRSLYLLDNQEINAFAIGEAMCIHYSQDNNVIRKTEGKLRVETLLTYTSFPTWEEIKEEELGWEQKVKEPFERALDKLTQCGFLKDWEYQYEGGIKIPDNEAEIKTYREFISLLVKFELKDFQDHQERAIEIKKKKEEQIKKLQGKRKNNKKTDDNATK